MELSDFFSGWHPLLRTLVLGICAYGALILMVRISGKRTLSALNAFDFIVTVAIGSVLAAILVQPDVDLLQGILALALLPVLQLVLTWVSVRSPTVQKAARSEPTMLCYQGKVLREALKKERMTENELLQALRLQGYSDPEEVFAAILETNGSVSVMGSSPDEQRPGALAPLDRKLRLTDDERSPEESERR